MKKSSIQYTIWISAILMASSLQAQIIYFNQYNQIFSYDVSTCSANLVVLGLATEDMDVGPGTTYYGYNYGTISATNSATGVTTTVADVSSFGSFAGLEVGPDGTIYVLGNKLLAVNPNTGAITDLGTLPNGWSCLGDMVYVEGEYYAIVLAGLIKVNITNPATSTQVSTSVPAYPMLGGAGVNHPDCPKIYWFETNFVTNSKIWEYDIVTKTWTQVCPGFSFIAGGAGSPTDYSFAYACSPCPTDAGTLNGGPINICTGQVLTVPYNNNAVLESDDLLQFIVFSDPNNPMGSLLATSNTNTIAYQANLLPGQTYYVAGVAGDNVGGNVSPADPCLDLSNFINVSWKPRPSVSYTSPVSELCSGQCATLTVNLVGTPPFTLTTAGSYAGNSQGITTQFFSSNTGAFTICAPFSPPSGSFSVQALSVTDALCTCN